LGSAKRQPEAEIEAEIKTAIETEKGRVHPGNEFLPHFPPIMVMTWGRWIMVRTWRKRKIQDRDQDERRSEAAWMNADRKSMDSWQDLKESQGVFKIKCNPPLFCFPGPGYRVHIITHPPGFAAQDPAFLHPP